MDKMWADGVSAMADISNDDSSFGVKAEHPMYTRTFLEVFGSEPHMCDGVMADVTALNVLADEAGIDAAPTPHSCYTMSPQLLSGCRSCKGIPFIPFAGESGRGGSPQKRLGCHV